MLTKLSEVFSASVGNDFKYFHKVENGVHYFAKVNELDEGIFLTIDFAANVMISTAENFGKVYVARNKYFLEFTNSLFLDEN